MKKQLLTGAVAFGTVAIGILFQTTSAEALSLDNSNVGQTFRVDFDGNVERNDVDGLSSTAEFTLRSFDNTQAILDILLTNTSDGDNITSSRVSAIGFNVDPDISGASVESGGIFSKVIFNQNNVAFPNGFGSIDLCATDGNTCQGGQNGGVLQGGSGSFALALDFSPSTPSFTLDNFGVRYQSIVGTDFGTSGTGTGEEVPIPTPALLPGLIGMGVASLRKKKKQVEENS